MLSSGDWLWVTIRPVKPSISDFSELCVTQWLSDDDRGAKSGLRESFPSDADNVTQLWRAP